MKLSKFIPDMEINYWTEESFGEEKVNKWTWLCVTSSGDRWREKNNEISWLDAVQPLTLFVAAQSRWIEKSLFVTQDCLLASSRYFPASSFIFPLRWRRLSSWNPNWEVIPQMLHPSFIMCWKRPHFHWAVLKAAWRVSSAEVGVFLFC